jgi:hypothetical protein
LRQHPRILAGMMFLPELEQSCERTEQEVTGTAGGINQSHDL